MDAKAKKPQTHNELLLECAVLDARIRARAARTLERLADARDAAQRVLSAARADLTHGLKS